MSITLNLTAGEEERLSDIARQTGLAPEAYAERLVREHLPDRVNTADDQDEAPGWPAGFFEQTYGSLAGAPLVRPPQGDWEVRGIEGQP